MSELQHQQAPAEETAGEPGPPPALLLGVLLTGCTLLALLGGMCWVFGRGFVDFPCDVGHGPQIDVAEGTRIAYCFSLWPRDAISGGTVYTYGASVEESIVLPPREFWQGSLAMAREGQSLVVNGQPLLPGQSYSRSYWFPSLNPWAILTAEVEIENEGISDRWPVAADVLYVSGDVYQGLLPSPVGLILLGVGVWLIVRGARKAGRRR